MLKGFVMLKGLVVSMGVVILIQLQSEETESSTVPLLFFLDLFVPLC